jgi:hypothetical protein
VVDKRERVMVMVMVMVMVLPVLLRMASLTALSRRSESVVIDRTRPAKVTVYVSQDRMAMRVEIINQRSRNN